MAEDVGGSPYSDGADHGDADDEFATVVFDEAFVRAAAVHEPSARERRLAAAEARLEPEPGGPGRGYELTTSGEGLPLELRPCPRGMDDDRNYPDPWSGHARASRRARWGRAERYAALQGTAGGVAQQRWHRPVAWVLAVIMGVGVVALAVAAIYRGAGGGDAPHRPEPGGSAGAAVSSPSAPVALPTG